MINPVIFSIQIGVFTLALWWYGVLDMLGVIVGAWFAEREISRRGEKGQVLLPRFWDRLKPGTLYFNWLVLTGLGRFIIEFFRPGQPHLGAS